MLTHDIDGVLSGRIGVNGLERKMLDYFISRTEPVLDDLRRDYRDGSMPLLRYAERRDDLAICRKAAERLGAGARDIVFLGTGGSSLGAQALAQIASWRDPGCITGHVRCAPRFHFFDNLDGASFSRALGEFELAGTRFIAISKSGSTAETLMQVLSVLQALRDAGLGERISQQFLGLTEAGSNPMRRMLEGEGAEVLEHDPGIGGRYSVLSNVGILPAVFLGIDPVQLREGAFAILRPLLAGGDAKDFAPALGAAVNVALYEDKGVNISVLLAYCDQLERFTKWHSQLWAESLGKNGKGLTPVAALGPVDQHSQLQLYLDGPADKLVTILMSDAAGSGPRIDEALADDAQIGYLAGKTLGDLVDCEQRASAEALIRNGRPVRIMRIGQADAHTLGRLFMHFMLETIIAGRLMGVDPFDQPAVEQGKILAREYLAGLQGR